MKILLVILLTHLSFSLSAGELDSVTLITPKPYVPPTNYVMTRLSQLGSTSIGKINALSKLSNYDFVGNYVLDLVNANSKDFASYYPKKGELDHFIKSTLDEGSEKHLKKINDESLSAFFNHLGHNLMGKIVDRILEKEGVTNPNRRAMWINKIAQPFDECMIKSRNALDSYNCTMSFQGSITPSLGIVLAYELSRDNLNSSLPEEKRNAFDVEQTNRYKTCVTATPMESSDVKACALKTMKFGIEHVTDLQLSKTIQDKASSKARGDEIKKLVWPSFVVCNQAVQLSPTEKPSTTDFFMKCFDNLIAQTGSLLVQNKISETPTIKDALGAAESKKLATEKAAQFKKCADAQKAKGAKVDGLLDISLCENTITNEVTYKVVSETLKNTAKASLKGPQALTVGSSGVKLLDQCWSNQQSEEKREACLKKTIVSYAQTIATIKVEDSIPAEMADRKNLSKNVIASFAVCLDKELPSNISESNDLSKKLDLCSGKLTGTVALKVADFLVRDSAKGNLNDDETENLVHSFVKNDFAKCLTEIPSDAQLENCSNTLSIKVAKKITELSFPKEVYGYLEKAGGIESLGLTKTEVDAFVSDLTTKNRECIDQKTNGVVMEKVNACVKNSIKSIALYFGQVQFNKSMGPMYIGRENDKRALEIPFKKTLTACISTKDAKEFTISDYTKNLYACADKVTASTTLIVGEDQVDTAIKNYLGDRPKMNLATKRESLKKTILGHFKTCMNKAAPAGVDKCIDELKREATKEVVVNYGRLETQVQLTTDKMPAELKPVEDQFIACTNKQSLAGEAFSLHLDECIKAFALNFAKELGELKLNYLLKEALGANEFKAKKKDIDESILSYNQCLNGLKKYGMNDGLTDKLTVCTDDLTNRGMNIVRGSIGNWMSTEDKDATTLMIKQQFATLLPCFSALLPSSPYTPELQANANSSLKLISAYLAHFIEYNPENAKLTLDEIIKKLSIDLNDVAKTTQAKKELVDFLYTSGSLDQFIKSMVRGTIKDTLATIPEKDLSKELREALLRKENFEEIFSSGEGAKIKDAVMAKLLKPVLVDNVDTKNPAFVSNMTAIQDNVIKVLIDAPSFGERAIKMEIQREINELSGFTKFAAKTLFGGDSLEWEKIRLNPEGIKAEAYIKEYVLAPKFKGVYQTEEEKKQIMKKAEELVTKAVKYRG